MRHRRSLAALAASTLTIVALAGCSASTATEPAAEAAEASTATTVEFSQELHDALPEAIQESGEVTAAAVSWAPHTYYDEDGTTAQGTAIDVAAALSELLGIEVIPEIVPAFADIATGISSGRFDMGLGPVGDTATMRESFDFVDWVQEWVVFAVAPGNPTGLTSTEDSCGKSIAVLAAGGAERVIKEANDVCVANGDEAIDVQSYADGNTAVLSVRSGRSDAYFASQANLSYFIAQSPDELELTGQGAENGFGDMRQGSFFAKDNTELRDVWLDAMTQLQADGVITEIMTKWNVEGNELPEFAINVGQ